MPKVQANGINIFYEYMGDGEPLALIGGSLFGRQNFGLVWEGLAKEFKLISRRRISEKPTWAHIGLLGSEILIRDLGGMTVWSWKDLAE